MEMGMEPRGAESVTFAADELAAVVDVLITCTSGQSTTQNGGLENVLCE
jgi:hypothetical protein